MLSHTPSFENPIGRGGESLAESWTTVVCYRADMHYGSVQGRRRLQTWRKTVVDVIPSEARDLLFAETLRTNQVPGAQPLKHGMSSFRAAQKGNFYV